MNRIQSPASATELMGMKGSSNVKTKADAKDFRDMLSAALKTGEAQERDTKKSEKINPAERHAKETQSKRPSEKPKPATGETDENGVAANPDAAAFAVVQPQEQDSEGTAEVLASVHPVQIQQIQAQAGQTQSAQEQAVSVQDPQILQQAQVQPQTETHTSQTQAASQATAPEASAQQAQQTVQTATKAASDPSDPNSAVVVTGTPEAQETLHTRPVQVQNGDTGEKQAKFDEMLSKAAQELDQSKTSAVDSGLPQALDEPIVQETDTGMPVAEATEAPAEAAAENEAKPATPRATVIQSDAAPKLEQKPLKEISKTDEATLGLIQQKPQEIPVPEVIRSEPAQPAQPAQPVKIPDQAEQIRTQVIENLELRKTEFRMQLNPQELGKVDVKMILESGKLAIEIAAANNKSTELLAKQAENLITSLKLSNIEVSSVNVVTASENASGYMENPYNLNSQSGEDRQGSYGSKSTSGGRDSQNGDDAQESEDPAGPQRMLNYTI